MATPRLHSRTVIPRAENAARFRRNTAIVIAIAGLWIAAAIISLSAPEAARAQSAIDEYKLKAAFIFHFAQLTDWPETDRTESQRDLFVCTLGSDPFDGELESTVAGKTIGSRTLRVRHLKEAPEAKDCQIVFVANSEMKRLPELLFQLANAPVMTIGETDGFIQRGGMLNFLEEGGKMRFEINLAPADRAGLKISSHLIVLAKNVLGSPAQE
jgi:hypothetical protein